jgi:hypothetical protein
VRCANCDKDCNEAFLNLGGYCCDEHRDEILRRHRQLLDELRLEAPRQLPETFTLADFERFALKLAVHLLAGIGPTVRQMYQQRMPSLLNPLEMALELKERILLCLPAEYVTLQHAEGLARLFRGGTYFFRQPVPAALVVDALRQARLLLLLDQGAKTTPARPTTKGEGDGNDQSEPSGHA